MNESYCYSASLSRFSTVNVLDSNKWLLNFLTRNSLMNCEAKRIFIFYLFAIFTSSFVRWLFRSFDQPLSCYFKGSMYILDHKYFIRYIFNLLSHSMAWHFIVFSVYFVEVLILMSSNLSIILFSILCFWCFIKKKSIQTKGHLEFLLCYLLKF